MTTTPSLNDRPKPRERYAKGVIRRQQILDRALIVFNELGYERTSMRAIAEAVGVTHPALAHYFGTREHLFIEVLREYDGQLAEFASSSTPIAELLENGMEHSMHVPGLMALLNGMIARALEDRSGAAHAYFAQRYVDFRSTLRAVLASGQRSGTVRTDISLEDAAMLVVAAADGLSTQWLLDPSADMKAGLQLLERLLAPPATNSPGAGG